MIPAPSPRLELLPCPFCGDEHPHITSDGDETMFFVGCSGLDCYCCVGEAYDRDAMPEHVFRTREAAIDAWNRRPSLAPTASQGTEGKPVDSAAADDMPTFLVEQWHATHPTDCNCSMCTVGRAYLWLKTNFDANVDRLKACEHIADGDEGWEALREVCPSTSAVGRLRDALAEGRPDKGMVEAALLAVAAESKHALLHDTGEWGIGYQAALNWCAKKIAALRSERAEGETPRKVTLIMKWYEELQTAAIKVIEATDHNLDTKDWPVKYAAPWEALTALRAVIARHLGVRAALRPAPEDGNG